MHESGCSNHTAFPSGGAIHSRAKHAGDHPTVPNDQRATDGAPEATAAMLLREHRRAILVTVRRFLKATREYSTTAEDIYQETCQTVYQRLERVQEIRQPRGWLIGIALNKCRDIARKRARRRVLLEAYIQNCVEFARRYDDLDLHMRQWSVTKLAATELPEAQREILTRALQGMSNGEIAQKLKMPEGTVRVYLHRAKKTLAHIVRVREDA